MRTPIFKMRWFGGIVSVVHVLGVEFGEYILVKL